MDEFLKGALSRVIGAGAAFVAAKAHVVVDPATQASVVVAVYGVAHKAASWLLAHVGWTAGAPVAAKARR